MIERWRNMDRWSFLYEDCYLKSLVTTASSEIRISAYYKEGVNLEK